MGEPTSGPPFNCPNDGCAIAECVEHGHCCAVTEHTAERVNVWMRCPDRWVILAKGHTRWHAELIARREHVVLPIGEVPTDDE